MNIYVGNLPLKVTEEELRREFTAFGEVLSVTLMNGKYISGGQSLGHGFVEMPSLPEGQAAIAALNGRTFRQRTINVIQALPLSPDRHNASHSAKTRGRWYSTGREQMTYQPTAHAPYV